MMKKVLVITALVSLVAFVLPADSMAVTGNGAPNGAHYNLNIIGVQNPKTADMTDSSGHVIFVPLTGTAKIMLAPGTDFQVTDANATQGSASFTLPSDVSTNWTVWARALGKMGGKATIKTCATYEYVDEFGVTQTAEYCPTDPTNILSLERTKNSKFQNVSKYLLFLTVEQDLLNYDGSVAVSAGTYPLFDPALEGYFWSYDNNGLKLLQLRFYPAQ